MKQRELHYCRRICEIIGHLTQFGVRSSGLRRKASLTGLTENIAVGLVPAQNQIVNVHLISCSNLAGVFRNLVCFLNILNSMYCAAPTANNINHIGSNSNEPIVINDAVSSIAKNKRMIRKNVVCSRSRTIRREKSLAGLFHELNLGRKIRVFFAQSVNSRPNFRCRKFSSAKIMRS